MVVAAVVGWLFLLDNIIGSWLLFIIIYFLISRNLHNTTPILPSLPRNKNITNQIGRHHKQNQTHRINNLMITISEDIRLPDINTRILISVAKHPPADLCI